MKEYKVTGMTWGGCEDSVRQAALEHGAREVMVVDREINQVTLEEGDKFDEAAFKSAVEELGYEIEDKEEEPISW